MELTCWKKVNPCTEKYACPRCGFEPVPRFSTWKFLQLTTVNFFLFNQDRRSHTLYCCCCSTVCKAISLASGAKMVNVPLNLDCIIYSIFSELIGLECSGR